MVRSEVSGGEAGIGDGLRLIFNDGQRVASVRLPNDTLASTVLYASPGVVLGDQTKAVGLANYGSRVVIEEHRQETDITMCDGIKATPHTCAAFLCRRFVYADGRIRGLSQVERRHDSSMLGAYVAGLLQDTVLRRSTACDPLNFSSNGDGPAADCIRGMNGKSDTVRLFDDPALRLTVAMVMPRRSRATIPPQ